MPINLTTRKKKATTSSLRLLPMIMAFLCISETAFCKEFDSQFVQRIGLDGLSVIGHLATIRAIDYEEDGTYDSYRLFQYVRFENTIPGT